MNVKNSFKKAPSLIEFQPEVSTWPDVFCASPFEGDQNNGATSNAE